MFSIFAFHKEILCCDHLFLKHVVTSFAQNMVYIDIPTFHIVYDFFVVLMKDVKTSFAVKKPGRDTCCLLFYAPVSW